MKRIIFTGTWRYTNAEVEADVRQATREVLARGEGIITGGATGVDYFCMDEAMKIDPTASQILVIIPAPLEEYIADYRANWCWDPITNKEIDEIDRVLHAIQIANPKALIGMPHAGGPVTQEDFNLRHDEEVKHADALYVFQVNKSTGVQDTINKAIAAGLPVELHKEYTMTI